MTVNLGKWNVALENTGENPSIVGLNTLTLS